MAVSSLQGNPDYKALIHTVDADPSDDCRKLTGHGKNVRLNRALFRSPQ
jgi:hypothetical protein